MKYQQPTFTLPTTNRQMSQTDYEIAVGLRNPDGTLVQPKRSRVRPIEDPLGLLQETISGPALRTSKKS